MKESAELDEVDRRLLVGIVQAPPKEKKRWDREDPAEERRRKKEKALARGEDWSDSYDDEDDDDATKMGYEFGAEGQDGSVTDLLGGKDGKSLMHKVQDARNKALGKGMTNENSDALLVCPPGFDPVKWAQMSRKEKMRALGISEAEWDKMTGEQQMKRMNKLAHGFHFYAMDRKRY